MTINLGGVPIQDVRVAGVQAQRVMLGTGSTAVEVWTATITIIATTPTFLTASPWVTLPSQEGVTYSLAGTPGYGATVTVTATPQAGYELAGQTTWMHTYGPPPRYVANGSGGARPQLSRGTWTDITTHTVAHAGTALGGWGVSWRASSSLYSDGVRVLRNGVVIATITESVNASPHDQTVDISERALNTGDTLRFQAYSTGLTATSRYVDAWSWSLS